MPHVFDTSVKQALTRQSVKQTQISFDSTIRWMQKMLKTKIYHIFYNLISVASHFGVSQIKALYRKSSLFEHTIRWHYSLAKRSNSCWNCCFTKIQTRKLLFSQNPLKDTNTFITDCMFEKRSCIQDNGTCLQIQLCVCRFCHYNLELLDTPTFMLLSPIQLWEFSKW